MLKITMDNDKELKVENSLIVFALFNHVQEYTKEIEETTKLEEML